jgi:hypothetical protein
MAIFTPRLTQFRQKEQEAETEGKRGGVHGFSQVRSDTNRFETGIAYLDCEIPRRRSVCETILNARVCIAVCLPNGPGDLSSR